MAKDTATSEILRAYGFDTDGDDGALIRKRGDRNMEMFAPVEGGWEFSVWRDGAWVRKFHHVDAVAGAEGLPPTMTPDYVWPDAELAHVYRTGVAERAAR